MTKKLTAVLLCAVLGACAEVPPPPPPPPEAVTTPSPPFNAKDFAWSVERGSASIHGTMSYGHGFSCLGQPVVLVPDTPYSRWRIVQFYGSSDRADLPVAEVRSRQANRPSEDYSSYSKHTTCDTMNRFTFDGLPAGGWFVIAVAQPGGGQGQPIAIMRRVETRAGAVKQVVLD